MLLAGKRGVMGGDPVARATARIAVSGAAPLLPCRTAPFQANVTYNQARATVIAMPIKPSMMVIMWFLHQPLNIQ